MTTATSDIWSDPRLPQVHEAASAAVTAAEAELAEADQQVTATREALALGRASRGDLLKAQRRLAQRQEARLQAEARVKALGREREAIHLAEREEREQARRVRAAALSIERAALEAGIAEVISAAIAGLNHFDYAIAHWTSEAQSARGAGGPGPGSIARPSDSPRSFGNALSGLTQMQRDYPRKGAPR
jgi:chromosome segregation ATPase